MLADGAVGPSRGFGVGLADKIGVCAGASIIDTILTACTGKFVLRQADIPMEFAIGVQKALVETAIGNAVD